MTVSDGGDSTADVVLIETDRRPYLLVLPHRATDYIQSTVARNLVPYEAPMLAAIAAGLVPGDLVLDVGANVGNHTLFLCAATGCRVVAYEPNRELSDAIAQSAALNGFDDLITVRAVGVGASTSDGILTHLDPANLGSQRVELTLDSGDFQVVSLDNENFESPVRVMKIDVEGMEIAVLEGAKQLLARDRPELYVECVDLAAFNEVDAFMADNGYSRIGTYNFTPTHHYVPNDAADITSRLSHALHTSAVHDYESRNLASDREKLLSEQRSSRQSVATQLAEAQVAYANATLAASELRSLLETTKTSLERRARNAESAYERVRAEALRYRDVDNAQSARLLDAQRNNRTLRERVAVLERNLRASKRDLRRTKRRLSMRIANFAGRVRHNPRELTRLPRIGARLLRSATGRVLGNGRGQIAPIPAPIMKTRQTAAATALAPRLWSESPRFDQELLQTATQRALRAGSRLRERTRVGRALRVAAIVDDFTANGLGPDCDLLSIAREEWESQLQDFDADILFVDSAWRGRNGSWRNLVSRNPPELIEMLEWCRNRGIATVFWNKEDPVHFETYLKTAAQFDRVYTTDIDMVPIYKRELGHDRVGFLPFASQPRVHNPIETTVRKAAMVFAGGYYQKYPDRMRDLDAVLAGASGIIPIEIFDRNYGTTLKGYAFPARFDKMIVGTLQADEIDVAYKGYDVALNLNSVKSSNSMFARRVFELLMSGTPIISNYAKGLRNLFGDLVPASDSPEEISAILRSLADDGHRDKLRTQSLRKVLREHTYARRLEMIAAHVCGESFVPVDPGVSVVARVRNISDLSLLRTAVSRQITVDIELVVITDDAVVKTAAEQAGIRTFDLSTAKRTHTDALMGDRPVAVFDLRDWHGPGYLQSLMQGFLYSEVGVNTKRERFVRDEGALVRTGPGLAHRMANEESIDLRLSIARLDAIENATLLDLVDGPIAFGETRPVLAVDPYDYCECGAGYSDIVDEVSSEYVTDIGVSLEGLYASIPDAEPTPTDFLVVDACDLNVSSSSARIFRRGFGSLSVTYGENQGIAPMWSAKALTVAEHFPDGVARFRLETMGSLKVQFIARWFDRAGTALRTDIEPANENLEVSVPADATIVRVGYRLRSAGTGVVRYLGIGHRNSAPIVYVRKRHVRTLLIAPGYPSYDNLYRLAFVHSRVRAYAGYGENVEVFVHDPVAPASRYEFEGQEVTRGNTELLTQVLASGDWDRIIVHFLNPEIWGVIRRRVSSLATTVWAHGVEIQPSWRRNYVTVAEREKAAAHTPARLDFWREVLTADESNLRVVFVSETFRADTAADLGIRLDASNSAVIHNPIDTGLFRYREKGPEARLKILSIRPYASSLYANDLSVAAVVLLASEEWFHELEFLFVGDGPLFNETLAPLEGFENVTVKRGFLTQTAIAELHRDYGVFLVPSRADTHGVSRDESMASGLVPITTSAGAIPEFVGPEEGFVVPEEDVEGLAESIRQLWRDPERYQSMSRAAGARVRRQSGSERVIPQELKLIKREMPPSAK